MSNTKRVRVALPGFARWDTVTRTSHREWIEKRARVHGKGRPGFGVVQALDEVLSFAKSVLGNGDAPDAATKKQAKRTTPVVRKANNPGKQKPTTNGKG